MVYSLSELLLTWGINRTLHFVQAMKTITGEQGHTGVDTNSASGASPSPSPGASSGASPGSGAVSVSVIALVHTTLHPPHILSRLLPQHHQSSSSSSTTTTTTTTSPSGFNCAIFVRANDGNPHLPPSIIYYPSGHPSVIYYFLAILLTLYQQRHPLLLYTPPTSRHSLLSPLSVRHIV